MGLNKVNGMGRMCNVKVIKDKNGNVLASSDNVLRTWKEYFEGMVGVICDRRVPVRGKMREGLATVALKWQN